MELDNAAQLAFGTTVQQEMVCRSLLPEEIDSSRLICECIGGPGASESTVGRMQAFELLSDVIFLGAKRGYFLHGKSSRA